MAGRMLNFLQRWFWGNSLWLIKERGIRYWIALKLVYLSRRFCDTTYYEAIVHGGLGMVVESNMWGGGISFIDAYSDETQWQSGEFDDWNKAVDWAEHTARSGR
jgi:hypothetical protein